MVGPVNVLGGVVVRVNWKLDGYTFCVGDDDLDINFDIDDQSGLVELSVSDNNGYSHRIYIKRDTAMILASWLKSRLSN